MLLEDGCANPFSKCIEPMAADEASDSRLNSTNLTYFDSNSMSKVISRPGPFLVQDHDIVDLNYMLAVPWAAADISAMFPGSKRVLIPRFLDNLRLNLDPDHQTIAADLIARHQ